MLRLGEKENSNCSAKPEHTVHLTFDEAKLIIQSGETELLDSEIKAGKLDVNMIDDKKTQTLLMAATTMGLIDCAILLLNHGADVNYRQQNCNSLLSCACLSGNVDMYDDGLWSRKEL